MEYKEATLKMKITTNEQKSYVKDQGRQKEENKFSNSTGMKMKTPQPNAKPLECRR